MAQKHNKLWRSVVSITLAVSLVLGSAATAFATSTGSAAANNTDSIKYVSLGDSMTSGYALPGYTNQGYYGYADAAYPNQFAAWLEKETGKNVKHEQLTVSGTRIEDIQFLLEFPMKDGEPDPAAIAVAESSEQYWNADLAEKWAETFDIGDFYTWSMLSSNRWKDNCGGTANIVKKYRKEIADADIISIATGNSDFSTFAADRIGNIFGTATSDSIGNEWIDFDQAIASSDPETKAYFLEMKEELKSAATNAVAMLNMPELAEKSDELIDVLSYTAVTYVLHYAQTLEKILEMNPDVEFVIMGIMDTKSNINISYELEDGTTQIISAMDIIKFLLKPINMYIAELPAAMQQQGNELYSQASFYFAESPKIPVLSNDYGNVIDDPDSVARERFVKSIVDGGKGIVWSALTPVFNELETFKSRNLELVPVKFKDVQAYITEDYSALSDNEIISCAVYMAIETAIIESSDDNAVDLDALIPLVAGLDKPLTYISDSIVESESAMFESGEDIVDDAEKTEEILLEILTSNTAVKGILQLMGSTILANGLGGHPTEEGHDMLSEAFINAYKEGYTVSDATIETMDDIMATLLKVSTSMFDSQQQIVGTLKKSVANLDKYAKAEVDNFAADIKPLYAGRGIDAELAAVEKELGETRKVIKAVKSTIGTLSSAVSGTDVDSVKTAATAVEAKMTAVDEIIDELNASITAAGRKAKALGIDSEQLKSVASEMRSYAALASATTDILKSDSSRFAYAPISESFYLALGDASTTTKLASQSYGRKLTKELGLKYQSQFANGGMDGMRVEDLLYILDENYEPDSYAVDTFGDKINRIRPNMIERIEKADLITVGFSNNTLLDIAISQMIKAFGGKATYEIDWSRYLNEDMVAEIEKMLTDIEIDMIEATAGMSGSGINMDNIGTAVRVAIENYLYGYLGFYMNYQEVINKITEINPDAEIVLIGVSNPFGDANLIMGEEKLPLGEYMEKLTDMMNLQQRSYAMMTGNAVYVDAPEVEVTSSAYSGDMQLMSFISNLIIKGIDTLAPSSNGHTYIKNQIVSAMKVVDTDTAAATEVLSGLYNLLNVTTADLDDAEKQISEARSVYDSLTDTQKADVDAELVKMLEFCESDFEYVKAFAVSNSSVTGLKAKLPIKSRLVVSWNGVDAADKYIVKIYRNGKLFKTVNTAAKSVSLKNITRGCTYKATVQPVRVFNGTNFEGVTKIATVTSKLDKANVIVKKKGAKVTVKSKDQNSTGFQVWVSTNKNFKKNVTKKTFKTNGAALNKTVALKKGTNYIKVRAYTTVGGKTVYGAWSKTVVRKK